MSEAGYIVLGGAGLIGSAVRECLEARGEPVLSVGSSDYAHHVGRRARVLINCNGNAVRYLAEKDPSWDFDASVRSVQRSIMDFPCDLYIYVSTVDVYEHLDDPKKNHEGAPIRHASLHPYAFHKWLAERLIERYARRWVILRLSTVIGHGLKKNPVYDLLTQQPLRISLDSELSLIDTPTIARCIEAVIDQGPDAEIYNIAPSNSVKLQDLRDRLGVETAYAEGAEQIVHRYNINNTKMQLLVPLPTAWEAALSFLDGVRPSSLRK